jgi:hypothetical protein
MPQGKNLDDELVARLHERECGEQQGPDEVEHGHQPWRGAEETSMISPWTRFSGGTPGFLSACR